MTRKDDSTLTPSQRRNVENQAARLLSEADAHGVFPTPIGQILRAGRVEVADESLDEGFVRRFYRGSKQLVKKAISKLSGLLHAAERLIFVDRRLHEKKILFIKLHETGHAWLPHQRDTYAFLEDCEESLGPDVRDAFEREANVFASEVLFQNQQFSVDAADCTFGVRTPIDLSKRYGASIYASMRRYVSTHQRPCALLVLNPPQHDPTRGFVSDLRRTEQSESFTERFGRVQWPSPIRIDDPLGSLIPIDGRRMSSPRPCKFLNTDGESCAGIAEGFTNGHQVFILILADLEPASVRHFIP